MAVITINGTEHEVTQDNWGIRYIDGMVLDDFIQTLSEEDMVWAAEQGLKLWSDDPQHAQDIVQRYEQ